MSVIIHRGAVWQMHNLVCGECDIPFSIPLDFARDRHADGAVFHCPRGHRQHFGESELEKARREIASLQQALSAKAATATAALCEARAERHRRDAMEAKFRRIGKGKCPCCKKTFKILARHVAAAHPDFVQEASK